MKPQKEQYEPFSGMVNTMGFGMNFEEENTLRLSHMRRACLRMGPQMIINDEVNLFEDLMAKYILIKLNLFEG